MEWLIKLIEKHTKDGVVDIEALKKEVNTEFPKYAVPKDVYNALSETNKRLEDDLKDRDEQLETLKKIDAEGLQAEITRLQGENKTAKKKYEDEMAELRKTTAIDLYLKDSKAKNVKAVKALLQLDKISLDGENLIGIKDQIETLKESDAYLFDEEGTEKVGDGTNPPHKDTKINPWKKETFNLTKQGELLRTNPALAAKLKAEAGK